MIEILCPICDTTTEILPRHPRRVCGICAAKAPDESGQALEFFNTSIGGGFITYHVGSHQTKTHPGHLCFIDGIRCCADGARFSGIAIQTLTDQSEQ